MCILRVQEVGSKHKGLVHLYHVLKRFRASKLSWPRPRLKIVNIDQCPVYTREKLGSSRLKVVHFLEKCYNSVLYILDLPRKIYKFVTEAKNKVYLFFPHNYLIFPKSNPQERTEILPSTGRKIYLLSIKFSCLPCFN